MRVKTLFFALVGLRALVESTVIDGRFHAAGALGLETRQTSPPDKNPPSKTPEKSNASGKPDKPKTGDKKKSKKCLSDKVIQDTKDGSEKAGPGQTPATVDEANFINFCEGKTLTNGKIINEGSCNGIPMGDLPAKSKMVSTIITSPIHGKEAPPNTDFDVVVKIAHMQLGVFSNPESTYYANPQKLSSAGTVIGHTHITIQNLGDSLTPSEPPPADVFAFFKGLNEVGDGKGTLKVTVTGGLPEGFFRICTLAGSATHQPVLMPVAQRGAQDDCIRIKVGNPGKKDKDKDKDKNKPPAAKTQTTPTKTPSKPPANKSPVPKKPS